MLRSLFKGPRTVRVPIDRSNVDVQQVKVTRQTRPLVGRFILTCVMTTIIIQGVKRWDPLGTYAQRDVLQDELERVRKDAINGHGNKYGKHWDKQHLQSKIPQTSTKTADPSKADAIRITVPIWLRPGPQRMYTETDPEWKEYVKLQGDAKRMDQIKRQIGESVMHQVKDGRNHFELSIIKYTGRVGVSLEIVPQIFTPPMYEVPCIWLSTSSVTAGWRPLPSQTGARMERVFRPVVLLEASTAAVKTFFLITYGVTKARVMETFGRSSSNGNRSTVFLPQVPPQSQNTDQNPSIENSKSTKPYFPMFPDPANTEAMKKMHSDVVSSMPYSTAIHHAAYTFNYVRMTRQKLAVTTNVRGICQVRGFITFFGERGKFRMEVLAYYLPGDNVFVGAVQVRSAYVVQDYKSWEKSNSRAKKQKEKKSASSPTDASSGETSSQSIESASSSTSGEDKEENK